jgi:hypothetical protein
LEAEDYSATHSLFHESAIIYKSEDDRSEAIRVFLDKAIHRHISKVEVAGMKADGGCEVLCGNVFALVALVEEKNDMGTGGCDASHQCGIDFRVYYVRDRVRPFLLSLTQCVTFMMNCR